MLSKEELRKRKVKALKSREPGDKVLLTSPKKIGEHPFSVGNMVLMGGKVMTIKSLRDREGSFVLEEEPFIWDVDMIDVM